MRVMIVGQKWLAAEVLRLCLARGDDVVAVSAPRTDDRLAALAAAGYTVFAALATWFVLHSNLILIEH